MFCVYHHFRPRSAKVRKTFFFIQIRAAWFSSLSGMSVHELAYVFPETGIKDFVISVFQGMWHDFFQPHPRPIKDLCASRFGFAFDFACLCPFGLFMYNWADTESFHAARSHRSFSPTLTLCMTRVCVCASARATCSSVAWRVCVCASARAPCSSVAWRVCASARGKCSSVAWRVCASARGTCSSVAWRVCRSVLDRYQPPNPTPPHPNVAWRVCVCMCVCKWATCSSVAWRVCVCVEVYLNVISPPHPTPPHPNVAWRVCVCMCVCKCKSNVQ